MFRFLVILSILMLSFGNEIPIIDMTGFRGGSKETKKIIVIVMGWKMEMMNFYREV